MSKLLRGGALFGTIGGGIVNIIGNIKADNAARLLQKQYPNIPADVAKSIGRMMATGEMASQESIDSFTVAVKVASASTIVPPSTSEVQEDTPREMLPDSGQITDSYAPAENGNIQPPALADIKYIEQLESNKDYAGAASLRYNALMNSIKDSASAGVDVLATDQGAVSMTAQMMKDIAKAQLSGTIIDPETRAMYEQAAQEVLGIKADAITQFASFLNGAVNTSDSVSMGTDLTGALSTIVSMKDAALKQVLETYVSDGNLDLPAAQTLYTLMQLREAMLGTRSDADVIIQETLVQLTSDALKGADVNTGNPALDDALMAAASSPHNLHAIQERWGMGGVNYAVNLIKTGHVKEAVLLAALPSYAKAVIVAEENMKNVTLNQDAILAQENAITQDMQDPLMVKYAEGKAKGQALNAIGMDLTGEGAMGDLSGYKTEVANAQAGWNESKAALHRVIQNEQNASNTLAQAQAEFYKDMSNSDAANAVVAAHQSLMEVSTARENAEQAFQSSQQALTSALKNLDGAQQLDRASVNAKAQQSYDEFLRNRAEARNNEQAGGQAGEQGTIPLDPTLSENVSNERKEGNPLVSVNESVIMGEGAQGEDTSGTEGVGNPGGQEAGSEYNINSENVLTLSARFLNKMDLMWKNSKNIKPIEGYQDIICHGDKESFSYKDLDGNEINLTPREFAEILKNSPVFEGGPVRLISCQAGAVDSFTAQYIANQLGVSVLAPTDIVYVYPDGEMKVGKYNTGSWALFGPKER